MLSEVYYPFRFDPILYEFFILKKDNPSPCLKFFISFFEDTNMAKEFESTVLSFESKHLIRQKSNKSANTAIHNCN
ncbi:hypothetical protein DLM78_15755 [Leptospira stimsonii]|uniref:Uncharacterized protein n=1 Tax=Leptospira stimsonii TaxID=2202203 RepID=A0A8B3CPM4_9LEPT|nr:hypothetical protein DLM78_15755 [Leptospira stimsonii]